MEWLTIFVLVVIVVISVLLGRRVFRRSRKPRWTGGTRVGHTETVRRSHGVAANRRSIPREAEPHSAYRGTVEVEDAAFTAEFERFIIRENCLSFQGSGSDGYGRFHFEGRSERDAQGQYRIVPMLEYPGSPKYNGCSGIIVIRELRPSSSGKKCTVRGYWQDEGRRWSIFGELTLFRT